MSTNTELAVASRNNGIAQTQQRGQTVMAHLVPQSISEAVTLAHNFHAARMFKIQSPEQALTILLTGMELGLAPATAMRGIHVIEGKPSLSADLMVAVVRHRRDICEYFDVIDSSDRIATCRTKRAGATKPVTVSFSWDDAVRAGLVGKDNWKKYPAAMLLARCKAKLARMVYEDLVMGLYTPDELKSGEALDFEQVDAYVEFQTPAAPAIEEPKEPAEPGPWLTKVAEFLAGLKPKAQERRRGLITEWQGCAVDELDETQAQEVFEWLTAPPPAAAVTAPSEPAMEPGIVSSDDMGDPFAGGSE